MSKRLVAFTTAAILIAAGIGGARAQSFYEGKTISLVVGFAPGGGFDTYARVLSRHMGRHIPGNPTLVVENMTGAGSLISANHLYRVDAVDLTRRAGLRRSGRRAPDERPRLPRSGDGAARVEPRENR